MLASVLVGVRRMEIQEVADPELVSNDVIVRPHTVGVCGTDFHIFSGESNYNFDAAGRPVPLSESPQVLGHEIAGTVEAIGNQVHDLDIGDRVVLDQGITCMSMMREPPCEYCLSGDSHQCAHYGEHGITGLPGGFAEFIGISARNAVRIDSDLSSARAALTEPLACILHTWDAVGQANSRYSFGGQRPVQSVLICGAGPAGLLFLQTLRHVVGFDGLALVTELDAAKRELARSFGAEVIDPTTTDVTAAVLDATSGRRVELVVECTGSGTIYADIPRWMRKQATVCMYGIGHGDASLDVLNELQWKEPTLVVSVGGSGGFDDDGRPTVYRDSLRLLQEGRIEVDPLLTHRYRGLAALPSAFEGDHQRPGYVKGVVSLVNGV